MHAKTDAAMLMTLLVICTIALVFDVQTTIAESTIYIRSDGSVDPSTASIQRKEDAYTFTNNIYESIAIQKNNTLIDGAGFTLQGSGIGTGFFLQGTENVTIKNTQITQFSQGIQLRRSINSAIVNNTVTNCTYGILSDNSPEARILSNTIRNNKWDGIFVTASPKSILTNNTIINQDKWGIYLGYSKGSILRYNKLIDNRYNFGVSVDFTHDIDSSNTISKKPIYYWTNQRDKQVPKDAGYVAIIDSFDIQVRNLDLTGNGQGILLVNSENSFIENSNITSSGYYGIQMISSHYNLVRNNTIARNGWGGIGLFSSTSNTIMNNTLRNNNKGIYVDNSDRNLVYQNNFINNTQQALSHNSINLWDSGHLLGGNYWSDYNRPDTDGDGIGDTPYLIDQTNQDSYPLMNVVQKANFNYTNNAEEQVFLIAGVMTIVAITILAYTNLRERKRKRLT